MCLYWPLLAVQLGMPFFIIYQLLIWLLRCCFVLEYHWLLLSAVWLALFRLHVISHYSFDFFIFNCFNLGQLWFLNSPFLLLFLSFLAIAVIR